MKTLEKNIEKIQNNGINYKEDTIKNIIKNIKLLSKFKILKTGALLFLFF